jgi:hypothetical protein
MIAWQRYKIKRHLYKKQLNMKKIVLSLCAVVLVIVACKKDKEEAVPPVVAKTTAEKVLGKWGLTSIVTNSFYSNSSHINTTNGTASDYLDFKSNGKVVINFSIAGAPDTLSYSVINDSTINMDGDINKIKEITDTKFVIYNKDVTSTLPLQYDEFTINLKK